MNNNILKELKSSVELAENKIEYIETIKELLNEISPLASQPVNRIRWVPIEQVSPNDYNPNSVAKIEMGLLYTSIKHDGYTQPVVTIFDEEKQKYVIVDGFHRYFTCLSNQDIKDRNHGYLPIVVIEKDINDRMASTVRHNRARGKHSITGMSNMVFEMLQNGWKDEEICNELGMQPEEVLKLKHITGFSKLFQDTEYRKAWEETSQLRLRKEYLSNQKQKEEQNTTEELKPNPKPDGRRYKV
jgi:ParB-like chromosome segregation protein Spo0J